MGRTSHQSEQPDTCERRGGKRINWLRKSLRLWASLCQPNRGTQTPSVPIEGSHPCRNIQGPYLFMLSQEVSRDTVALTKMLYQIWRLVAVSQLLSLEKFLSEGDLSCHNSPLSFHRCSSSVGLGHRSFMAPTGLSLRGTTQRDSGCD